jgi:hypothetical protein
LNRLLKAQQVMRVRMSGEMHLQKLFFLFDFK